MRGKGKLIDNQLAHSRVEHLRDGVMSSIANFEINLPPALFMFHTIFNTPSILWKCFSPC